MKPISASARPFALAVLLLVPALPAGAQSPTSSSASYTLLPGAPGQSGGRISGGLVAADTYTGPGAMGLSGVSGSGYRSKDGYSAQLYDSATLTATATPSSVDEGATSQLSATATLDDGSTVTLAGDDLAWSVQSGPLSDIDGTGLATAGPVYTDTAASALGSFLGASDSVALTVLNVGADDFGTYADDGIDDDWQVQFFGEDSPDAGPGENPDDDRDDNTTEFLFGFSPVDPLDFFTLTVTPDSGTADLTLSKVIPGRTYTLRGGVDPQSLGVIGTFSVATEQSAYVTQDPAATEATKFYQIEATKP